MDIIEVTVQISPTIAAELAVSTFFPFDLQLTPAINESVSITPVLNAQVSA